MDRRLIPGRFLAVLVLSSLLAIPCEAQGPYTVPDLTNRPQLGSKSFLVALVDNPPSPPLAWIAEQVRRDLVCQSYGRISPVMDQVQLPEPGPSHVSGVPEFRKYVLAGILASGRHPAHYHRIVVLGNPVHWKWAQQQTNPRPGGGTRGATGRIDQQMLFNQIPAVGTEPPPHQTCGLPPFAGAPNPFPTTHVVAHEMGHTFGWSHANLWYVCPQTSNPLDPGAEIVYGDEFDIMGDQYHTGFNRFWPNPEALPPHLISCTEVAWPNTPTLASQGRQFHHFNPWFKQRAGWLTFESGEILDLTSLGPGTHDVCLRDLADPLTHELCEGLNGPYHAVRVQRDADHDYWFSWRRYEDTVNHGQPGSLENRNGPVVTIGHRTNLGTSVLVDTHPGEIASNRPHADAPLALGETFTDPGVGGGTGFSAQFLFRSSNRVVMRFKNIPPASSPPPTIGVVNAPGAVDGPPGSATDTAVYQATWEASAFDPAGAPIASVEMWIFPWTSAFRLRDGNMNLFPRKNFCTSTPGCTSLPASMAALKAPGSGPLTTAPYVWQAGGGTSPLELKQGRYFLVIQATTATTPPRTNFVWWSHTVTAVP